LPELFVQWSKFKDSPKSEQPQDSVINFEGLECFWPTFSTATKKEKDQEPADGGCMFSNDSLQGRIILFHLISTRFSRLLGW
jgi:hypothetical protein